MLIWKRMVVAVVVVLMMVAVVKRIIAPEASLDQWRLGLDLNQSLNPNLNHVHQHINALSAHAPDHADALVAQQAIIVQIGVLDHNVVALDLDLDRNVTVDAPLDALVAVIHVPMPVRVVCLACSV